MYLSFDIGGTFVKYAWMNKNGEIMSEGKFNTPYKTADNLVHKMVSIYEQSKTEIKGIAISCPGKIDVQDRKSTRLNSSHVAISYAVFCLKEKNVGVNCCTAMR